jgi:hypothetical protein
MKEINLKNTKILYIGPASVYYDQCLIKKLEDRGATVTKFDLLNFFSDNLLFRTYIKFLPKTKEEIYDGYKNKFYDSVYAGGAGYDYVLVRHGYQLDVSFLNTLRNMSPNAKFINFHWDSLREDYDYLHNMKCYDKVYSFDVKDCKDYNEIIYRPLFFLDLYDSFRKKSFDNFKKKDNDLLFIGAWRNKERLKLINQTEELCKKNELNFKHYLYLSFKRHVYLIKKGVIPTKTKMKILSHEQILDYFATTNTIIDFPSSFQTGMTIRTFETLGAGKKLITTNQNIINEPFYDEQYINVVDMNNLTLNVDFIKSVPDRSMEEKLSNYSLDSYINTILQ